jgi:hypothetical protein
MARDKSQRRGRGCGRDGGGFVALPWSVLDSEAYKKLSHPARSLLMEFARQYVRDNNGRLLASLNFLKSRGWNSSDVIHRAKVELLAAGFIFETVKGHRPNKASWYAITWQNLDKDNRYDYGTWEGWKEARSSYQKIAIASPSNNLKVKPIVPPDKLGMTCTNPLYGAINAAERHVPIPSSGNHLEIPSAH